MRIVDRPAFKPARCAAIPFLGPASHPDERWIDTGSEMEGFDNHVYLSETAVRQCMSLLGYVMPLEVEALQKEFDELVEVAQSLHDQLIEQDKVIEGMDVIGKFAAREAKRKPKVAA